MVAYGIPRGAPMPSNFFLLLTAPSSSKSVRGSSGGSSTLTTYAVSAKELQMQELSRIVIAITIQEEEEGG
jgi:hypothetical protein